jgi:hypothetical protein
MSSGLQAQELKQDGADGGLESLTPFPHFILIKTVSCFASTDQKRIRINHATRDGGFLDVFFGLEV